MQVFLSYSRQDHRTAEEVELALRAEGHSVFFDRTSLPEGDTFHAEIRRRIEAADILVFLVSPDSIRHGSYALTELKFAREKWPNPASRVLPVLVRTTPNEDIPPYLLSVTVLEPAGNIAAEVAAALLVMSSRQIAAVEPVRVLTHAASFDGQPDRPALFVNVTNLSPDSEAEITHVWLETVPRTHVLNPHRVLPVRLRPLESWETWIYSDLVPPPISEKLFEQARVRLSTGDVIESKRNTEVPERGFVPGARA